MCERQLQQLRLLRRERFKRRRPPAVNMTTPATPPCTHETYTPGAARRTELWAAPAEIPSGIFSKSELWAAPAQLPSDISTPSNTWAASTPISPDTPSRNTSISSTPRTPAYRNKLPPIITSDTPTTTSTPTILGYYHNGPTLTPPRSSPTLQLSPIPTLFDSMNISMFPC